jgi:hypothetical protein
LFAAGFGAPDEADGGFLARLALVLAQPFEGYVGYHCHDWRAY